MANENQNLMLAGLFNILAALIPLFKHAGDPQTAADIAAITGRADKNYQEIIDRANQRTTPTD